MFSKLIRLPSSLDVQLLICLKYQTDKIKKVFIEIQLFVLGLVFIVTPCIREITQCRYAVLPICTCRYRYVRELVQERLPGV